MSETDHTMPGAAPSLYPVVRLIASVMLVTMGGAAMYAVIVVLKPASFDFNVSRGVASVPYMLFMLTGGDRRRVHGAARRPLRRAGAGPDRVRGAACRHGRRRLCRGVLAVLRGARGALGPARHLCPLRAGGRRHLALVHAAARARRRDRDHRNLFRRRAVAADWPGLARCAGLARDLPHHRHRHGVRDAAAYRGALSQAGGAVCGAGGAHGDRCGQTARLRPRHASKPDLRGRARLLRGDGDAASAHRRSHLGSRLRRPARRPRCCR